LEASLFEELFPFVFLIAVVLIIAWLLIRIKKSGRNMITTIHGAMYETYDKDKRAAVEQVLEQKVKKMQEQENDKPVE